MYLTAQAAHLRFDYLISLRCAMYQQAALHCKRTFKIVTKATMFHHYASLTRFLEASFRRAILKAPFSLSL